MKANGPIPSHFSDCADGQLLIEGRAVEDLVSEAGGTPLFVYDNNVVGGQIARFRAFMPAGMALYHAVTSNPYEPLLAFLGRYVDGFRIVSLGELEHLQKAGLGRIAINFAGPGKQDHELDAAVTAGATISVESQAEAHRSIEAGERVGIQPKIAVRVSSPELDVDGRPHPILPSPFGVEAVCAPALIQGLLEAGVDWRGIHMFAGSQCLDERALIDLTARFLSIGGGIAEEVGEALPEFNLGGGFDIPCFEGQRNLDLGILAAGMAEALSATPDTLATTRYSLELGRWLVGEAGVYLTRVIDRKSSGGRTFLVTDGGGHHFQAATGPFAERSRGNYPIAVASRYDAPRDEEVSVTGCLCAPFDVLGDEVMLPRAEPGDLIAVFCAGAYGPTASPRGWESRPAARELLI